MSSPDITLFAQTNYLSDRRVFGVKRADRRAHLYVIGRTGTGKSTLLATLMRGDLAAGAGFALLDPHGDLVERVFAAVPEERREQTVYLNVPDPKLDVAFNPLGFVAPERRPLAAAELVEVFKTIWATSWGPRLEHLLRNVVFGLLDVPGANLADVARLLKENDFRRKVATHCANPQVRTFWLHEYEGYSPALRGQIIAPFRTRWEPS